MKAQLDALALSNPTILLTDYQRKCLLGFLHTLVPAEEWGIIWLLKNDAEENSFLFANCFSILFYVSVHFFNVEVLCNRQVGYTYDKVNK